MFLHNSYIVGLSKWRVFYFLDYEMTTKEQHEKAGKLIVKEWLLTLKCLRMRRRPVTAIFRDSSCLDDETCSR